MKHHFRALVAHILESQVVRLQKKTNFKVIAVVGSIGKTSTKLAIGQGLARISKVRYQEGNYNDRVTVPLVVFGHNNPSNVLYFWVWLIIFIKNEIQIRQKYKYEWVVLELGTDAPGQIIEYNYLKVDLAVVTGITPEHMQNFADIDAVAKEELSVALFSKNLLINTDLCDEKHLQHLDGHTKRYGTKNYNDIVVSADGPLEVKLQNKTAYINGSSIVLPKRYTLAALFGVLQFIGQNDPEMVKSILDKSLTQVNPGRLQILAGINDSTIIDDTYNASPEAVRLALDVLKRQIGSQKIAILGSMNELGSVSEAEHSNIGKMCKPKDIDLLVTIGKEASKYLAPAAESNGCVVNAFLNPYEAGVFIKSQIKSKAVILAKGSQNGVFAEEALKSLLKNEHDQKKLVRQSDYWLNQKRQQFEKAS